MVHILENNKKAISNLISEQVKKWDTKTMTDLIELQVGKDIQYIRINGTIIGGFIGVLIYLLSLIFFHKNTLAFNLTTCCQSCFAII